MRLKNFSLVLTALAMLAGSNAFAAYEYRINSQSAVVSGACISQPAVVTNGCLTQSAIVEPAAIPGPVLGAPIIRSGKTLFDMQLFGLPLLHFGMKRQGTVAATQTLSQVVLPAAAACEAKAAETTVSQAAVIPQPEPVRMNLKDVETTTTITRWYRRTR